MNLKMLFVLAAAIACQCAVAEVKAIKPEYFKVADRVAAEKALDSRLMADGYEPIQRMPDAWVRELGHCRVIVSAMFFTNKGELTASIAASTINCNELEGTVVAAAMASARSALAP